MANLRRTHTCGELRDTHVGQIVILNGWVNTYRAVSYLSPFGGYKDSGMGRENGIQAIYEYLQLKSVWINSGAATGNPFVMR